MFGNRLSIRMHPNFELLEDRCLLSAGFLDPTFAGDGMVTTNFKLSENSIDNAWDVAVYPGSSPGADGKIVAVGRTVTRVVQKGNQSSTNGWDYDFGLVRYNPNGSLDTSFGQDGKVTTDMGTMGEDIAYSVELVGNKILAAGWGAGFALARYNDNGSLDTTFGSQGKVFTKVNSGGAGLAMKVDPLSGKIVVAGRDPIGRLALVRYTANGALDKAFGKGGIVTTSFAAPVNGDYFGQMELAITPASAGPADAGKIVVVGLVGGGDPPGSLLVARYTTAGQLDASFDNDGTLIMPVSATSPSVSIQSDGRIVVSYTSAADLQLLRLDPNGAFDTSFDGDGQLTLSRSGTQYITSVAIQPDGKILVAGDEFFPSQQAGGNFFVARFSPSGELDPTYGVGGFALSAENNLNNGGQPNVELALQENGKAVVCGWTYVSGHSDFAVARFQGDDALHAATAAPNPVSQTLSLADVQPLMREALSRWQTAGIDTSSLQGIDIRIADLGGTTLGLASGHTIWLDDNAGGWGWFVDPTPGDDSEFTTPGDQGEQEKMDLLTVLEHEVGHLLGRAHDAGGVMAETLSPGTRLAPFAGRFTDWLAAVDVLFAEGDLRKRR